MMLCISNELVATVWPELVALGRTHFAEVFGDGADPCSDNYVPVFDKFNSACVSGTLRLFTARFDGVLVGYIFWSLGMDCLRGNMRVALLGPWYSDCAHKAGLQLLQYSIAWLEVEGVKLFQLHHRLHGRGARLGPIFKRLGAVEVQHEYELAAREV